MRKFREGKRMVLAYSMFWKVGGVSSCVCTSSRVVFYHYLAYFRPAWFLPLILGPTGLGVA